MGLVFVMRTSSISPEENAINRQLCQAPKAFLTLNDASAELGCSRRFLEKRIEDGEILVTKPSSKMVRIRRKEWERWVESYTSRNSTKIGS